MAPKWWPWSSPTPRHKRAWHRDSWPSHWTPPSKHPSWPWFKTRVSLVTKSPKTPRCESMAWSAMRFGSTAWMAAKPGALIKRPRLSRCQGWMVLDNWMCVRLTRLATFPASPVLRLCGTPKLLRRWSPCKTTRARWATTSHAIPHSPFRAQSRALRSSSVLTVAQAGLIRCPHCPMVRSHCWFAKPTWLAMYPSRHRSISGWKTKLLRPFLP